MTSLNIGQCIFTLLHNNATVTNIVGNKIYPLIAENGTTYPFIIYRRSSFEPQNNKDCEGESIFIEVYVVTNNYHESVELVENVRQALEGKSITIEGLTITDIYTTNAYEEFTDDGYIQQLTFKVQLDYN